MIIFLCVLEELDAEVLELKTWDLTVVEDVVEEVPMLVVKTVVVGIGLIIPSTISSLFSSTSVVISTSEPLLAWLLD